MGYAIYIGRAVARADEEGVMRAVVESTEDANAPQFPGDIMTGQTNARHPSYYDWNRFCKEIGWLDLFFGDSGIMREHPGCFELTCAHLDAVLAALNKRRESHPDAVPGFAPGQDGDLARLLWLAHWMDAALKTDAPAIFSC